MSEQSKAEDLTTVIAESVVKINELQKEIQELKAELRVATSIANANASYSDKLEKENQELKEEAERWKGDYEILSSYANIFRVKEQAKEIEELKELANDLFCGVEYLPKDLENKYKKLLNNKKQ
jgi:FtsZ-binding cell division protein ZapB